MCEPALRMGQIILGGRAVVTDVGTSQNAEAFAGMMPFLQSPNSTGGYLTTFEVPDWLLTCFFNDSLRDGRVGDLSSARFDVAPYAPLPYSRVFCRRGYRMSESGPVLPVALLTLLRAANCVADLPEPDRVMLSPQANQVCAWTETRASTRGVACK